MEIGTFWMLSERRCAVTVISSSAPVSAAAVSLAGAAAWAADDTAPKIAATANETFEFMRNPRRVCSYPAPAAAGRNVQQATEIFAGVSLEPIERRRHPDVTS